MNCSRTDAEKIVDKLHNDVRQRFVLSSDRIGERYRLAVAPSPTYSSDNHSDSETESGDANPYNFTAKILLNQNEIENRELGEQKHHETKASKLEKQKLEESIRKKMEALELEEGKLEESKRLEMKVTELEKKKELEELNSGYESDSDMETGDADPFV